ncbi:MAG: von Willebrand factor type A domain-containing protein, partial [Synergistaceae bacterium]|nr:von Willebrand factor type A domain-containing protein [Synergistaceae bacterium]
MKKIALIAVLVLAVCMGVWHFSGVPSRGAENQPNVSRDQIARILARSLARIDLSKASDQDRDMLKKLVIEFRGELESMGVDVTQFLTSEEVREAASSDANPPRSTDLTWAYDAIAQLAARGVISGYPDGTYTGGWRLSGQFTFPEESFAAPSSISSPAPGNVLSASEPMRFSSLQTNGFPASPAPEQETARYGSYSDNPVKQVATDPVATFGLDVNTTSYANVRRFLNEGRIPPADAVRVEELINYFPPARDDKKPVQLENSPFHVAYELAPCPWDGEKTILWLSLTARGLDYAEAPPANLVFLVDVSGSMNSQERLPLVKSALKMLVNKLRPSDNISLVTYAGRTSLALPATSGEEKDKIISAIDNLGAGGSTAGAAGLTLAYEQARKAFINGGV